LKSESDLKTEFVNSVKQVPGWYATRIEDQYRVGIPDILIGIPYGPSVMIEAKRVAHQSFGPSARQWIELQRWDTAPFHDNGQHVLRMSWLLGFKEGVMYLHTAADQVKIGDCLASTPGELPHNFILRFLQHVQRP
jgi:hypothetical protein